MWFELVNIGDSAHICDLHKVSFDRADVTVSTLLHERGNGARYSLINYSVDTECALQRRWLDAL